MTTRYPDRIELQQRMFLLSRAQRLVLWGALLLFLGLLAAAVAYAWYKSAPDNADPAALLTGLWGRFTARPLDAAIQVLMLVFIAVQAVYLHLAQRNERLVLTRAGIEYRSALPAALRFLRPGWSLSWAQIRAASLRATRRGTGPVAVVLELDGGTRRRRLFPYQWVDPQHHRPLSVWTELRRLQGATSEAIAAELDDTVVMRHIAAVAPHLRIERALGIAPPGFALERSRRALGVLVALLALLGYALADGVVLGDETYAGPPPYAGFVAAGALAAMVAGLWLRRGSVPVMESVVVALLFGGALGVAAYPAALRVNALTDAGGLRSYEFRLTAEGTLEPLSDGLPVMAFPRYRDYWAQFPAGSVHAFELRRGGLGFYQLNLRPLEAALRNYYQRSGRPEGARLRG